MKEGIEETRPIRVNYSAELDELVKTFEAESLALPPTEAALRQWAHKALSLGKRVRDAEFHGKGKLHRRLQRFHLQLRQVRAARRRFVSQRDFMSAPAGKDAEWQDQSVGLPRNALADAIHVFVDACVSDIDDTPETVIEQGLVGEPDIAMSLGVAEPATLYQTAAPLQYPAREESQLGSSQSTSHYSAVRPGATRVDPIMAIEGRLALPQQFEKARETAIAWLRKKGIHVAPDTWDSFEVESKDKKNRAIAVAYNRMWALQVETSDTHVKDRRWRVEMVLVDNEPTAGVGVRLTAISPAHEAPPPPSIPGLVSALILDIGLLDAEANEQLFSGATMVETPRALKELLVSLHSTKRRRPVLVMSQYQKGERLATLMEPTSLAQKLRGVARVYVLSREMSWGLTRALTKRFAVGGASIRLFRPGFTLDDSPISHPKWDPTALEEQKLQLSGLAGLFVREAADASIQALEREDSVLPFDRIRERVLKKQIEEARQLAKVASTEPRSEKEILAIKNQLNDETALRELFEESNCALEQELRALRHERETLREEFDRLKASNHYLRTRINQPAVENLAVVEPEFPQDWDDLEEWCEENVEPLVRVSSKAVKAARESVYENIPFAYQVLYFMAKVYAPYRRQELSLDVFEEEKNKLNILVNPVGRAAEEKRTKHLYSAMFEGKPLSLDMHVKGSADRSPKFGFRLYFHWHEQEQCVVVGSFPTHLRNSLTN